MTPQQLQAIQERWEKPLREKWRHVARAKGNIETEYGRGVASCHVYASNVAGEDYIAENLANADRIIYAPTDIALLLAEVRRLQEENSKILRRRRQTMAEMTASEAIAVLHNNQYQKHIGNGEYDYIHPLTDAECKGIESLIQQQAQTIESLKCCGNCKSYQHKVKEEKIKKHSCYVGNKLVEFISIPDPVPEMICLGVDGSGKCDKWEGLK